MLKLYGALPLSHTRNGVVLGIFKRCPNYCHAFPIIETKRYIRDSFFEYPTEGKRMPAWEELRAYQPRVPHPHDYEWPKGAPDPLETTRERFHEFMRGRPMPFTFSVGGNLYRNCSVTGVLLIIYVSLCATRGDDFEWVDAERKRLHKAKKKLERIKKHQERQQRVLESKAIETAVEAKSRIVNSIA